MVALGGGAVLSERVREALVAHVTVLLEIEPALAWERVRPGAGQRPLARDSEAFAALHAERRGLYEGLADAILPAERPGVAVRALPALRVLAAAAVSGPRRRRPAAVGGRRVRGVPGARRTRTAAKGLTGPRAGRSTARPRGLLRHRRAVGALYEQRLGALAASVSIPPGESHKTLATAERVWRELARARMTRADHLIALGGGVVGDLAGFCAATYQRGVPVVQVPTTLVAQVDSAYGGKTGVDLPEAKNYVGAYHQPAAVVVDPDTLGTLPAAELHAGWVEVLKTALLAGGELWERVARGRPRRARRAHDPRLRALQARGRRRGRARRRRAARSSTSGTPSATRSRPPPATPATATARPSASACSPRCGSPAGRSYAPRCSSCCSPAGSP